LAIIGVSRFLASQLPFALGRTADELLIVATRIASCDPQ
jgi:hypothetical protein